MSCALACFGDHPNLGQNRDPQNTVAELLNSFLFSKNFSDSVLTSQNIVCICLQVGVSLLLALLAHLTKDAAFVRGAEC